MFKVYLGDVTLDIPPERKVEFTGPRELAKYDIPGDRPRYQDMGMGERVCKFNGLINEDNALAKAETVRALMDKGEEIKFLHGEISVKVLIRNFNYAYHRPDYVRYDIELVQVATNLEIQKTNIVEAPKAYAESQGFAIDSDPVPTLQHLVRQGENLRAIATEYCKTPHDWISLAKLNKLTSADVPAGTVIKVPNTLGALADLKKIYEDEIAAKFPAEIVNFESSRVIL